MQLRLPSGRQWILLFAACIVLMVAARTVGIEVLYQYNAHHLIRPSRIDPRNIAAPVPVHVLRANGGRELSYPAAAISTARSTAAALFIHS
ncbi:MAG: hypothetical protein ABI383_11985 [Acidobacteriaceae bacterium]